MPEEFFQGANGKYFNKFGSIVYPRLKDRKRALLVRESTYQPISCEKTRSYKEFEIQAVAYNKLRELFKNDQFIQGEYAIKDGIGRYIRCDLAIFDRNSQLVLIIEVKRSLIDIDTPTVKYQLDSYKKYAPLLILSNMKDAENIISILFSKGYITPDKFGWDI